jgi:hypothetical protein
MKTGLVARGKDKVTMKTGLVARGKDKVTMKTGLVARGTGKVARGEDKVTMKTDKKSLAALHLLTMKLDTMIDTKQKEVRGCT